MQKTLLITGGAGYIGSHTAFLLAQQGYHVVIVDALYHNQPCNFPWATFVHGDIGNGTLLRSLFEIYSFSAVLHFAAFIEVHESVRNPLSFYENNVVKTLRLLETMIAHDVKRIIFSSSCAVYGIPQSVPLHEDDLKNPISPYGTTKLMVEMVLKEMHMAYDLEYVALRYFNASGALPEQGLGEKHNPETHLIPCILNAARDQRPFTIFGTDHTTPDGSCIRDFLHVLDIARAHVHALSYLEAHGASDCFNLGTGKGVSVLEMLATVEKVMNTSIPKIHSASRAGDPAILIADATKAQSLLQWQPEHSSVENIIKTAYEFSLLRAVLPVHASQSQRNV